MMYLRESQLKELQPKQEDPSVTAFGKPYDEHLDQSIQSFWNLFTSGMMKQTVTCKQCNSVKTQIESFTELMLNFPLSHHSKQSETCTLNDLFKHNSLPIDLEAYVCDCCKKRTIATKHVEIDVYPECLIIVLCREIGIAEINENNVNTVNTAVEFPLEGFATVSNVHEQSTVVDYNLIGTVNYKAKTKGGHYTAITKNADKWYCYDDQSVSIIPFRLRKENKAKIGFQRMATILLYCRSSTSSTSTIDHTQDGIIVAAEPEQVATMTGYAPEAPPPPESPAQAPDAVLASEAAGPSPADDEVIAEEVAATAPSQVALRSAALSQETAAASTAATAAVALISVAPSHESAAASTAAASTTAVSAAPASVAAAATAAPEHQPDESATMNLDRNEDKIVDLTDYNSDEDSLFNSSAKNDDDIPLPPAHINFEQFVEREEGHFCTICLTNYSIRDKALGTFQLPIPNDENSRLCHHVFCYECLQKMQIHTDIVEDCTLPETVIRCPLCNRRGVIEHHKMNRNPRCNWANGTDSLTGWGNTHDECCPYPGLISQKQCQHDGCTAYVHKQCHRQWLTRHHYDFPDDLKILCRNHDANYLRWVRFKAREIPRSENGTIPMQPGKLTDRVPRKGFWCDWAMGTMMDNGRRNPHQECCVFSHIRYIKCQHEGCTEYVHQLCQRDWLTKHGYEVPTDLPTYCHDHTESYGSWVRFTAGDIPRSQNGTIPGSVAAIGEFRGHV
jgi:hypothetical protein